MPEDSTFQNLNANVKLEQSAIGGAAQTKKSAYILQDSSDFVMGK